MDFAVEIPAKVKERLALGQEQSWVVLSEWNEFIWPGPVFGWCMGLSLRLPLGFCHQASFQGFAIVSWLSPRRGVRSELCGPELRGFHRLDLTSPLH
jgi:hypothetical protein